MFEYPVQVSPHLTDYAGVVWHGAYLRWLEEARLQALQEVGLNYADLVALGCDLPVVQLDLKYLRSLTMGQAGLVRSQILRREKVRLIWRQVVYTQNPEQVALEALVTLVPLDRTRKKVMRQLPAAFETKILSLLSP
ncbi:acyl-CoA thioesterase [Lyngbya confervoides]|uniref:Acyl-CoA thioesterase n=1 Tax=Lyngbya confervoides BDU141951 TaxID=1574623 RepID=A0ABD4T1S6_9CYAN|nr:thioesterase family protein [Lyngbya confervoides]MCM1982623.1 acyl-CoA thioesterase [Lyngbya confervoides BDU141951]